MNKKIAKVFLFIPFMLLACIVSHYIHNFIELIFMYPKYSADRQYAYKFILYIVKLTSIGMITNLILNQLKEINTKEV